MSRPRKEVIDGKQQCIDCQEWLELEKFTKHSASSTGRNWRCNECHKKTRFGGLSPSQRARQWSNAHPERAGELNRESRQRILIDPRRLLARRQQSAAWYSSNREKAIESHRNWRKNNPWAIIADSCRSLVRMTLLSFGAGGPAFLQLVGCDGNHFRAHIQSLWQPGMSWANFGRSGWTIGHIKSVAEFKEGLLVPEVQRQCFHWSNLRPEWYEVNVAKHTKRELTKAQIGLLNQKPNQAE